MIAEICFEELLLETAQSVFETMIFMDVNETYDPVLDKLHPETVLGSITFNGTIEGCLSITCGDECARQIAMNMLGMDEDEEVSAEEIDDAIGEVSNMLMGNIKATLVDDSVHIQVSIPTVMHGGEFDQYLSDISGKYVLQACLEEKYPVRLLLQFRMSSESETN